MTTSDATARGGFEVSTPADAEVRMTRTFDAPPALVFEAMNRPEHVRRWWGCLGPGYSVPVCEIDLRPGGAWRFVNRTPQGEFGFHGTYREVAAPGRVVFTEVFELFPDTESVVTGELTAEGGGTRLTVTIRYPSREVRDAVLGTGMPDGAAISYERLADLLGDLQSA